MVSVTTYRDAGFLPQAFINFLCLLGWSPKNDREQMTRQELIDAFTLEGVNRSNAVVNFTEDDPFDPKAVWLNAEHIRTMPVAELSAQLLPVVRAAGFAIEPEKMLRITPLVQERIRLLRDVLTVADFFFADELAPYDPSRVDPQEGRCGAWRCGCWRTRLGVLAAAEFTHDGLEGALRGAAARPGHQGRPDVRADPRGGMRTQDGAAAIWHTGSAGARDVPGAHPSRHRIHRAIEKLKAI